MNKGKKTRRAIQEHTKMLIFEKSYGSVTMTDIAQRAGISVGGLYHHYHSVESVVLDIFSEATGEVWNLVEGNMSFNDCLDALHKYFELEKYDLLHFNSSVNNIIYQYFFSFPTIIRQEKMNAAYQEVITKIENLFSPFIMKKDMSSISNHIYVILHGLTTLAMTGSITEIIIDCEFKRLIEVIVTVYKKQEVHNDSGKSNTNA